VPEVVAAPVKLGVKVSEPVPDRPVACPEDPEQAATHKAPRMNEAMYLIGPR
jgi:hypothetical protein